MLFESYTEEDYENAKATIPKASPNEQFINALGVTLTFKDVQDYIDDADTKLPSKVLVFIAIYLKRLAKLWKVSIELDQLPEEWDEILTHRFIFIQYLDEWNLLIQTKTNLYSYALNNAAKRHLEGLAKNQNKQLEHLIQSSQDAIASQADTIVMIKILYYICKTQNLFYKFKEKDLKKWQSQLKIIDMFLFSLYNKKGLKTEQFNFESQSNLSFNPPPLSQSSQLLTINLENSLENSREKHQLIKKQNQNQNEEMIQLTKPEFNYMITKFKQDIIEELKRDEESAPHKFLANHLQTYGQLISQQTNGQIEYYTKMDQNSFKQLLEKYGEYHYLQLQNKKYKESQQKAEDQYNYYLQFQQLLNYYYQTDPQKYTELVNEYNQRLNNQIIDRIQPQKAKQQELQKSTLRSPPQLDQIKKSQILKYSQHQGIFNASKSKILQSNISKDNQLIDQKPMTNIICSRYNKSVGIQELNQLQYQMYCSENILNFFIRFLDERQSYMKSKKKIFYLSTTFYKALNSYNIPDKINYEQASHYTKSYIGKNQTIFDKFDLILIPIVLVQESLLITINLQNKTIIFYDSILNGEGAKSMAQSQLAHSGLLTNQHLLNCIRFLEMEYNEKIMKPLNLLQWQTYFSPHEKCIDYRQSNLMVALIIKQLQSDFPLNTNQHILQKLGRDLSKLLQEIGVTQNKKNELNFQNYEYI